MTVCTKHRFPDVEIRIVHSTASLTGFSVVMKIQGHAHQATRAVGTVDGQASDFGGCGKGGRDSAPSSAHEDDDKATRSFMLSTKRLFAWKLCNRLAFYSALVVPPQVCARIHRRQCTNLAGVLSAACMFYVFFTAVGYMRSTSPEFFPVNIGSPAIHV
jgi:hypothetical protein